MHPIENILNITMTELKEMVDVDTIVGKPFVTPEGQTIVPISKVSVGFVSGGGQYDTKQSQSVTLPFAGGSSAGISIAPVAFMVSGKEELRLMTVSNRTVADKVLEQLPEVIKELRRLLRKKEEKGCETGNEKGYTQG